MTGRALTVWCSWLLCAAVLVAPGCGSGAEQLPVCEQGTGFLTVRTIDRARTIAAVSLEATVGQCFISSGCVPAPANPDGGVGPTACSEVLVLAYPIGTTCTLTITSVDDEVVTVSATVVGGRAPYRCRDGEHVITASLGSFQPSTIAVDFRRDAGDRDAPDER